MKLVVTIDVEEEGLFNGRYESRDVTVENVAELARLDPVFREWSIKPTLLITHPVARDERHRDLLTGLKEKWRAEIGAHLHPWNTPPFQPLPHPEPVPSELMPRELLEAKLQSLFRAIGQMDVQPASFRMGRFNMGPKAFSLLDGAGILVDSSVAPMRRSPGGPDHLTAPADPYFPDPEEPCRPGRSRILEVPITILPISPRLGSLLEHAPVPKSWTSWFAMNLGSLSLQPMWTGLGRLKAAAQLHRRRDGQVLTIHFHSSELMPGGCPRHSAPKDVHRFLAKLRHFFAWLHREMAVESLTLSELGDLYRGGNRP